MGCHTWFFRKVERPYSEARIKYITAQRKLINTWEEICDNPGHRLRIKEELTQEDCMQKLALLHRQKRIVSKGLCRIATMNHQPNEGDRSFIFVDRVLYSTDKELPHDLFRVFGYPDVKLKSLEDTFEYIVYFEKFNQTTVEISSRNLGLLRDFWTENPDGLIIFGE